MWKARRSWPSARRSTTADPRNWFAGVNFNYYDDLYLPMNPLYRTATRLQVLHQQIIAEVSKAEPNVETLAQAIASVKKIRNQEKFGRVLHPQRQRGQELVYPPQLRAGIQPRGEEHSQRSGHPHGRLRADAHEARCAVRGGGVTSTAASSRVFLPVRYDLLP